MRILFTQRELIVRAGSEMFTIDAARELRSRGHEVIVWSPRNGELATALQAYGVPVITTLQEIPWKPEVIHGQHHMQTMAALAFFYGTPVIYHCHGHPWVATPPLHRLIRHYVVMASAMVDDMEATHGIPRSQVTPVSNFVDLQRFHRARTPPPRILRAVAFGNNHHPGPQMDRLQAICRQEGIALDTVGLHFGKSHARPEHLLQEYDLVFAIGKCAIEAIACGCAVLPVAEDLAGHLILPDDFSRWAASNFSPRMYGPADRISIEWLREELGKYRPELVAEVTRKLRAEHSLKQTVSLLETIYEKVVQASEPTVNGPADIRDTGLYLEKFGRDVDLMNAALIEHRQGVTKMEHLLKEAHLTLRDEQIKKRALRDRIQALEERIRVAGQKKDELQLKWNVVAELLRRGPVGRWFLSRINRRFQSLLPGRTKELQKRAAAK